MVVAARLVDGLLSRLANERVELLELAVNLLGELDIALMQHGETPAHVLVGAAEPDQLLLLRADAQAKRVALGDQTLNCRSACQGRAFHRLAGCKFTGQRFSFVRRRRDRFLVHSISPLIMPEETVGSPCRPRHFLGLAVRKCGENGPFARRVTNYAPLQAGRARRPNT